MGYSWKENGNTLNFFKLVPTFVIRQQMISFIFNFPIKECVPSSYQHMVASWSDSTCSISIFRIKLCQFHLAITPIQLHPQILSKSISAWLLDAPYISRASDCCLMPSEQFFSPSPRENNLILMRWWGLLCTRLTR
jgi:hypothetical protein